MRDLFGVKVETSPWIPVGTIMVLGDFPRPPEWDTMSDGQRLAYAVAQGAIVTVKNVGALDALRQWEGAESE